MSEPIVVARSIAKSYVSGTRRVDVLHALDFDVRAGEAVAIIGDSGVGKSTLMHVLGGLDPPDEGTVRFRGENVYDRGVDSLARYRNRQVGFVFQFHHLLPEFTALENVVMPFRVGRRPLPEARARAGDLLGRLGLADRVHHHPSELSGGEQQRVAIARAVATAPGVLLADEPTGNLDPGTGARVFGMLREIQAQEGFALVLATHSGRLAGGCERILRLDEGRLRAVTDAEIRAYFDGVPG